MRNGKKPTLEDYKRDLGYTKIRVENYLMHIDDVLSLSMPLDDKVNTTLEDFIYDDYDFTDDVINNMCKEEIWNIAKEILTTRNFEIMLLRCGKKIGNLGSEESMTLEEIGAKFDLTKERVRQIEVDSHKKLKEKLKHYR